MCVCFTESWVEKPCYGKPLEEHLALSGRDIAFPIEACVTMLLECGMQEEVRRQQLRHIFLGCFHTTHKCIHVPDKSDSSPRIYISSAPVDGMLDGVSENPGEQKEKLELFCVWTTSAAKWTWKILFIPSLNWNLYPEHDDFYFYFGWTIPLITEALPETSSWLINARFPEVS